MLPGNEEEMLDMPSGRSGLPIKYCMGAAVGKSNEVRIINDQGSIVHFLFSELQNR